MLPFVGMVDVGDLTAEEVAHILGERVQAAMDLPAAPGISVSVSGYAPVSILGDVAEPGRYVLAPGTPVEAAIAAAGGVRPGSSAFYAARRDGLAATQQATEAAARRAAMLAQVSRLEAVAQGRDTPQFPPRLGHPDGAEAELALVAEQEALFRGRTAQRAAQRRDIENRRALVSSQLQQLRRQLQSQNALLDDANAAAERFTELSERGLMTTDRMIIIQNNQVNLLNSVLGLERNIFESELRLQELDGDLRNFDEGVRLQAEADIIRMKEEIEQLSIAIAGSQAIGRAAQGETGLGREDRPALSAYRYDLVSGQDRERSGAVLSEESVGLLPGDILTIIAPESRTDTLR